MPDPVPLRPLRKHALVERVVGALQQYVDANGLRPGDRLPAERELAGTLGVGRSSVREAVATLRANGVVEVRHGEGLFLLRERPAAVHIAIADSRAASLELPYIWETRQALETQCARIAAVRATAEDLAELDASLELMAREIDDGGPGLGGDRRFHEGVAQASHNPVLTGLLDGIRDALDRTSRTSLGRPGQPARSLADHHVVLAAIRAHEPTDAGDAMLAHLVGTTDPILGGATDPGFPRST